MARRGSYAKGIAKREEILASALGVVARLGYSGASVREIADEVNLSQAGLLHYFGSKEELFVAILDARDAADAAAYLSPAPPGASAGEAYDAWTRQHLAVTRHNMAVPGLVELFTRLAAEASSPQHPAHDYFLERSRRLLAATEAMFADAQEAGRVTTAVPSAQLARMLHALSNGLQMQWLVDAQVDMPGAIGAFFDLVAASAAGHQASR